MIPPLRTVVVAELDGNLVRASSTSWVMMRRSFCSLSGVRMAARSRTGGRAIRQVLGWVSETSSRLHAAALDHLKLTGRLERERRLLPHIVVFVLQPVPDGGLHRDVWRPERLEGQERVGFWRWASSLGSRFFARSLQQSDRTPVMRLEKRRGWYAYDERRETATGLR